MPKERPLGDTPLIAEGARSQRTRDQQGGGALSSEGGGRWEGWGDDHLRGRQVPRQPDADTAAALQRRSGRIRHALAGIDELFDDPEALLDDDDVDVDVEDD